MERQNQGQTATLVPGPLAIALLTGRPEMARMAVASLGDSLTKEYVEQFSNYAESVVREIQVERELTTQMYSQIHDAVGAVSGVLNTLSRIEDAFRLMRDNAGPEAIEEALRNKKV